MDEYLNYLDKYKSYKEEGQLFFRGQLSKFPNMIPSVARDNKVFTNEYQYYQKYENFHKSVVQNLARMQHDGNPTRFLDFTTDPLVALFFATQSSLREDASVYLFIRQAFDANSKEVRLSAFIASQKDRNLKQLVKTFNEEEKESISVAEAKMILSRGIFVKPNTIKDPDNLRMLRQEGTFAIPGNLIEKEYITEISPFENDLSFEEIVIPFEYQEEIRKGLVRRGYTREKLLGEADRTIKYDCLSESDISQINPRYIQKAYCQYSVTVESKEFMTVGEMEQLGYRISKDSKADSIWIWFRRPDNDSGNNILIQHWYKESVNKYDWSGSQYKDLTLDETKCDSYITYEYFKANYYRINYKHLPNNPKAKLVNLEVVYKNSKLLLKTNLLKGTKLSLSYRVNDNVEKSVKLEVSEPVTSIDVQSYKEVRKLEVEVIMIVPILQNQSIIKNYGIDFEKIKGDFIQRNENGPSVGYKKFVFNCGL
nr:FRG domain-containing protein [Lactobacillus sp. 3B(2020)]